MIAVEIYFAKVVLGNIGDLLRCARALDWSIRKREYRGSRSGVLYFLINLWHSIGPVNGANLRVRIVNAVCQTWNL